MTKPTEQATGAGRGVGTGIGTGSLRACMELVRPGGLRWESGACVREGRGRTHPYTHAHVSLRLVILVLLNERKRTRAHIGRAFVSFYNTHTHMQHKRLPPSSMPPALPPPALLPQARRRAGSAVGLALLHCRRRPCDLRLHHRSRGAPGRRRHLVLAAGGQRGGLPTGSARGHVRASQGREGGAGGPGGGGKGVCSRRGLWGGAG